ncbi:MAG TPA: hypothetical protein PLT70_06310 [bacterium]|jgi:hypothetical protein|nr:hypothetical protein [bacterium]HPG35065.1 hypothetical protein [bacterium]HPM46395.1 hypothetical protein [bacterium]HQI03953.1 hypothetical protein [bacterium]HQJ59988.1 hypothetical protein [bacterium]
MLKELFALIFIFFFAMTPLTGEEKKEEPKKPKVKTGVEVEKGDNAPKWEDEILKKKKEAKKESEKEMKKEKREKKLEKNKERNEKRKKSGR